MIDEDSVSASIDIYFTSPKNIVDLGCKVYIVNQNE